MKIKSSPLFVVGSRALILAVVFVAWAVSRAATAQDDGGSEPVASSPDDGSEPVSKPAGRDSAKSPPETPRGIPTTLSGIFRAGGPMM